MSRGFHKFKWTGLCHMIGLKQVLTENRKYQKIKRQTKFILTRSGKVFFYGNSEFAESY